VTGASGFVGAQVTEHLLAAGYAVRGTSRFFKADELRKNCMHKNFEVVIVDDIIEGDFSEILKGVHAIIHLASPLASGKDILEVAVGGTLNILHQAHKAKVYKVTIISSYAATISFITDKMAVFDSSRVINGQGIISKYWSTVTKEEATRPGTDNFTVYAASKALSERATWEFVESHPEMDVITLLPPFIFGPISQGQVILSPSLDLSTNRFIYLLISGENAAYPPKMAPQCVDVRDVARACVLSLNTKPAVVGERRRILLSGGSFSWKQAAKHIAAVKPELKGRLVDRGEAAMEEVPAAVIDINEARETLGLMEFIPWERSIEDAVDSLLHRERMWSK
ncbi:NAD(P)-binding protein, partial [Ramaria rubella]